ncbi:36 and H4 lysine-20 specific [Seminavis robusta]|uniref:36 and H4 lysine-20 specific n=1 Tax=Seminavis robusta TaxID=568900 RepID=A0A9N8H835_9STRA|nr:36 and H4 lysine-20 specific [Seminavis robusta]|eukprot:Sro157_g071400.1 36 and H4 lysine-20 specific (838) ;mRNA; f:98854-101367
MDPPGSTAGACTTSSAADTPSSTTSTKATQVTNDSNSPPEAIMKEKPFAMVDATMIKNKVPPPEEQVPTPNPMVAIVSSSTAESTAASTGGNGGRRSSKRTTMTTTTTTAPPPAKKKPKTSSKKEQDLIDMAWICVACREAECAMDMTSDLLICEGPCRRLFHTACAGLAQMPCSDESWTCHDCRDQRHLCACCQEYGNDQEDIFKCQKQECGLFFHEACLNMQNIAVKTTTNTNSAATNEPETNEHEKDEEATTAPTPRSVKFTCPAHWCWTCTQDETMDDSNTAQQKTKTKGRRRSRTSSVFVPKRDPRLYSCLECPTSYHLTCIPPSCKVHELALLCHEHAENHELPALDMEASFQGTVEAAADKKLQKLNHKHNLDNNPLAAKLNRKRLKRRKARNPFFPAGVVVDRRTAHEQVILSKLSTTTAKATDPTKEDDEMTVELILGNNNNNSNNTNSSSSASSDQRLLFGLPQDIQEEVHSKPPLYKHIHSLKYYPDSKPKKIPPTKDICNCVDKCDEHCLNWLLYKECVGEKGSYTNCRLGPKCGNRKLGLKQHVKKCKPMREQGRGWGLAVQETVKRGGLVQEYLGDVIDEPTKEERLRQWNLEHPNDPNYYIMCLSSGWYVDARETANMARFINHSCDPNCILWRFNVGGYMRDGIFALRDIQPGEFLSYDYHFDTKQGDKFVCRCGSKNCRGTMKEQQQKKADTKKTKGQLWEQAKQKYEKDKEYIQNYNAHEKHNATVWAMVPGTSNSGNTKGGDKVEWTSNGVPEIDRFYATRSRVFLWRTAVLGSNFASRNARMERRRRRSRQPSPAAATAPKATMDVLAILEQLKGGA